MCRAVSSLVLVVSLVACSRARHAANDRCLSVAPAVRGSLTAGPDGETLYWLERVRRYDFDANLDATWRVVQYDLRTQRETVLFETAAAPIRFIGGDLVALQGTDHLRLVLLGSDGHLQELTPEKLDVQDL